MSVVIYNPSDPDIERAPGLSEETLRSIAKDKRAYPHEIVAMVTELVELRERFKRREDLIVPAPVVMRDVFEQANVRVWKALNANEKQECQKLISMLGGAFVWQNTYPGEHFWNRVSMVLEDLSL